VHVRDGAKGIGRSRQRKLEAKKRRAKEWRDSQALESVQVLPPPVLRADKSPSLRSMQPTHP